MAEQIEVVGKGPRGPKGWTPVFASLVDGARKIVRIDDWTGGQEPKPATGYIGAEGLVDLAADATDFSGLGVTSLTAIEDSTDILVTYTDGSIQTVSSYFAPFIAAAADVEENTIAVSQMLDMVETKRADVAGKYEDFIPKQADFIGKYNDFGPKYEDFGPKYTAISNDATAVSTMFGFVQDWWTQISAWMATLPTTIQTAVNAASAALGYRDAAEGFKTDAENARNIALAAKWFPLITDATATRTLVLADAGREIRFTYAGAISVTVPPAASVAWAADTEIVLVQAGAGQITVVPGAGVTINSSETLKSAKQYAYMGLKRVAANTWDLTGERQIA